MSFVSKRTVARKATPFIVATTVAVVTMLAPSRADAELLWPSVPTLTWGVGIAAWMPPHELRFAPVLRASIVATPAFSAFAIGLSGLALTSFRSDARLGLVLRFPLREPLPLCIGPSCPGQVSSSGPSSDEEASASAKAGSMRLITGLGPVAVAALGLFSTPVATEAHPVVMRVSPMFAFGGGGLEMKCAWW